MKINKIYEKYFIFFVRVDLKKFEYILKGLKHFYEDRMSL